MRGGRGGTKSIGWCLTVCATWACSNTVQLQPEPIIPEPLCALVDAPSIGGDTATITFEARAATREQCALVLAAEALRPWPGASRGPWTVLITVRATDATIRVLDVSLLPWDRTYVRLSALSRPLGATAGPDAVHADARLAEAGPCEFTFADESPVAKRNTSKRVVYDGGDRTARELAERLVAVLE